jgi:hypothetical protein
MDRLSAEQLKELLYYDPVTGVWTWLKPIQRGVKPGAVAGCYTHKSGYGQISVGGKLYLTHRLAWLYMTGEWPEHEVDHRDGVPGHDQWDNLRSATVLQNRHNVKVHKDSTTGVRGVSWSKWHGAYLARICCAGKQIFLGSFSTLEGATSARVAGEKQYFGEFSSLHREGDCVSQRPSPVFNP